MITRWSWRGKKRNRDGFLQDAGKRSRLRPPSRRLGTEVLEDRRLLALSTIDLNSGLTPTDLVESLIGGGLTVSNVSYTGDNTAGGQFLGGVSEGLEIESGVLLSSGNVADAAGPNDSEGTTTIFSLSGDPDLDGLIPGFSTNDAAVLEFDFVAVGGTLSFNYVFGSEEYNEFVNSSFNDVFGFFLDGVNIALIPGTSTPVSINNVNNGSNSSFYKDNSLADFGSPTPFGTQADGFTVVLQATATLSPGPHHIKLAIADAGDTILDSWVFLVAESFTSGDSDLALSMIDSPDPVVVENPLTYTLEVINHGPDIATDVFVTDTLPAGVTFVGASASQGTVSQTGGVVTAELGQIDNGASATVTITVLPLVLGTITNTATVEAEQIDEAPENNVASQTTTVEIPVLSINDVQIIEGNSGTKDAVFTVSSNGSLLNSTITVNYATVDATASGGTDYVPVGGVLAIAPGATSNTITVPIIGDTFNEVTESFLVRLSIPVNANILRNTGIGTIIDNDLRPALYVNDVQVTTNEVGTLEAVFTVALDMRSGRTVSVEYTTVDGTAHVDVDYRPRSGVLEFPAGVSTLHVTVQVLTSDIYAPNELFFLEISNPVNAVLADPVGVGTSVFAPLPPMEYFVDDGDPGYSRNAGWTNVTNLVAYKLDYDYHASGTGAGAATWTFNSLLDGPYEVFTRWVHFSNRATNAPYTVLDGATPLGTVRVNQQLPPTGDHDNGISWQSLGMYEITSGTLSVRLTDDANGYVIADAVRIVRDGIPPQAPEIDVSQWGHSIHGDNETSPTLEDGTHFGNVLATAYSTTRTFTIKNTGNADLHLTGSPSVQLVGDHPGDFIVAMQPSATVAPGDTTTFDVIFHPATTGVRRAIVSIGSDDADESLYQFAIEGIGADDLVALAPAQNVVQPLDVDANSVVSGRDALLVINALLRETAPIDAVMPLAATAAEPAAATPADPFYYLDVDGNGVVSARDALLVINHLILQAAQTSPPATGTATSSTTAGAVQVFVVDRAISQMTAPTTAVASDSDSVAAGEPAAIARPAPTKTLLAPANVEASFEASDDDESPEDLGLGFE